LNNVLTSMLWIYVYYIDPIIVYGNVIDHRIKNTLGITEWSTSRVLIDRWGYHLDVGSSQPGGAQSTKGSAVRRLKRYVSWV